MTFYVKVLFLAIFLLSLFSNAKANNDVSVTFSEQDLIVLIGEYKNNRVTVRNDLEKPITIKFHSDRDNLIKITPASLLFQPNETKSAVIQIYGKNPGHVNVLLESNDTDLSKSFIKITVERSNIIKWISLTVGWIYFVTWSVSFYPQIHLNFSRRSVIGLNFDFVAFNVVGYILYSAYNVGMYFVKYIQDIYAEENPTNLNPVHLNDVVFSVHALACFLLKVVQCFVFPRGGQKVSREAWLIIGGVIVVVIASSITAICKAITWFDCLNYCSYIKVFFTLVQYTPQAYMNYKRQSTEGWCIGNVLLDILAGSFSILQIFLDAYNADDWSSILNQLSKLGLGLFSVGFDVLFIFQHYVFYRHSNKTVDVKT